MKILVKFIFTKIFGWKIIGNYPQNLKKYVVIGAPHTSQWDFFLGIAVRIITNTTINFIAKDSFFKPPFGFIFRKLGGMPVDRSKSTNMVDGIVKIFNTNEAFRFALSPEGTRKKVVKWKTGFYYIAKGAKVPIVLFGFDFGKKQAILSKPYYLTDNMDSDFAYFENFYKDIIGKHPEKACLKPR